MVDKHSFSQNIYILYILEITFDQGIAYNHLFSPDTFPLFF